MEPRINNLSEWAFTKKIWEDDDQNHYYDYNSYLNKLKINPLNMNDLDTNALIKQKIIKNPIILNKIKKWTLGLLIDRSYDGVFETHTFKFQKEILIAGYDKENRADAYNNIQIKVNNANKISLFHDDTELLQAEYGDGIFTFPDINLSNLLLETLTNLRIVIDYADNVECEAEISLDYYYFNIQHHELFLQSHDGEKAKVFHAKSEKKILLFAGTYTIIIKYSEIKNDNIVVVEEIIFPTGDQ